MPGGLERVSFLYLIIMENKYIILGLLMCVSCTISLLGIFDKASDKNKIGILLYIISFIASFIGITLTIQYAFN